MDSQTTKYLTKPYKINISNIQQTQTQYPLKTIIDKLFFIKNNWLYKIYCKVDTPSPIPKL